jgi:YD repeat-containing protein
MSYQGLVPVTYSHAGTGGANPDAVTKITSGSSGTTYAYDLNGNLTSAGNGVSTTTYSYDYNNSLIALLLNGATSTTYGYDAFGTRVYQISATSSTTTYPYKFYAVASTTNGSTNFATSTEYAFNGDTLLETVDQGFKNGAATGAPHASCSEIEPHTALPAIRQAATFSALLRPDSGGMRASEFVPIPKRSAAQ